jgi:hypothetical protein
LAALAATALLVVMAPANASWQQPYGGCEEASLAPHSAGANQCRAHGWTIKTRLVVNGHGVLKGSGLPHCREEDGTGQRAACSWNFPDFTVPITQDGNGKGLSYWVGVYDKVHYVWPVRPIHGRWHWVTPELGDALAEGEQHEADWTNCMFRWRHGLAQVMCPDGFGQTAPH